MLGIPYSVTAHANDIFVNPILLREKLEGSVFTVTVSEFNRNHLQATAPELPAERLVVLHPWVDVASVEPRGSKPGAATLHIVSVGRLVEKKGHRHLIEACGLLGERGVDVDCTIIGAGPLHDELGVLIDRLAVGDRVRLTGALPQADVRSILSTADVFVLACVVAEDGDRDGIPVSIAEAMSMAIPVVSTDLVGISELVHPGAGFLAPPGDPDALADRIEEIAGMEGSEREKMGAIAREVVEQGFDLRKGVRVLAELYADTSAGGDAR
jgi:glycosyltransferase involved in cell wall biosynthesis